MRSDPAQRENAKSNTACGCLFCITGKECLVAMRVQTQYPQIHAVAVRKEKHITREGRKLRAEAVLLPSYVFFEAPADADVSTLAELQDVIRILSMDAGVWQLQGEDERFARWLLGYDGLLSFSQAHREGDHIRILRGPLKDMEGRIVRVDKRGRSGQVLLNFNGREIAVWLGFELVEEENPLREF